MSFTKEQIYIATESILLVSSIFPNNESQITDAYSETCQISKVESGFELVVRNSQFAKRFDSLRMNFYIFYKNCESLKSDTWWIFRVIHWTSHIVSYFKPIKYPLFNNKRDSWYILVQISLQNLFKLFS